MAANNRCRVWTFVTYPDSVPDNWEGLLNDLQISWSHSPLHDKDLNADDAEKKAHWHCFVEFDGVKSYDQVLEITKLVHATIPQRCRNPRMMHRYFIHLDNPEKYQYSKDDIYSYGIDIESYFQLSAASEDMLLDDMIQYIDDNDINYFSRFYDICRQFHRQDWFPLVSRKFTFIISTYIKSRRVEIKDMIELNNQD